MFKIISKDTIKDRQSVEKISFKNGLTHSKKKKNNFLCTYISLYLLKNEKKSLVFLKKIRTGCAVSIKSIR